MSDELKENILSPSQWIRILYMIFFGVVCWLLGIIVSVVVVAQVVISLIMGKDNENLRQLGASLSQYFAQILEFLTYVSEVKPFPFSAFPGTGAETVDVAGADETVVPATDDTGFVDPEAEASDTDDVFADMSFTDGKAAGSGVDPAEGPDDADDDDKKTS